MTQNRLFITERGPRFPALMITEGRFYSDYWRDEPRRSWRNWLSDGGARFARPPSPGTMPAVPTADDDPDAADATARGMASELVLACYGRIPLDSLKLGGNRRLFDQLVDWDPEP